MASLKLEYLLFDLGNVFVYWNKDSFIEAVIDGLPDENFCTSEYSDPFWLDLISYESNLEKGHINWAQFCQAIELRYGWKGCSDTLLTSFQDIFKPNRELIDWFTSTHFSARTILMSNTNIYHWKWISQHYEYLLSKFDHLHLSHEVGFRKPNQEYYLNCDYKVKWERALFVDDLQQNLLVPRELGAAVHHFLDSRGLWRHLKRCTF